MPNFFCGYQFAKKNSQNDFKINRKKIPWIKDSISKWLIRHNLHFFRWMNYGRIFSFLRPPFDLFWMSFFYDYKIEILFRKARKSGLKLETDLILFILLFFEVKSHLLNLKDLSIFRVRKNVIYWVVVALVKLFIS